MANRQFKGQPTAANPEGADVPKGDLGPLNEMVPDDQLAATEQAPELVEAPEPEGEGVDFGFGAEMDEDDILLSGDDDLLFGPSDRPWEPITSGASFGPGPSFRRGMHESHDEFMDRVADMILSQDAHPQAKEFAERVKRGL